MEVTIIYKISGIHKIKIYGRHTILIKLIIQMNIKYGNYLMLAKLME